MLNNQIKQNISFGIIMLVIFGFGITYTQNYTEAYSGCSDCVTFFTSYNEQSTTKENNPIPAIESINPNSSNLGTGIKTITITGSGFVPSSVARINGLNRPTTFIDSSHLLVQITGNDTYKYRSNGGFFITVFNGAPGGGYSNADYFAINTGGSTTDMETVNDTSTEFTDTIQTKNGTADKNNGDLASNAIFGTNGIFPSSLIQWILFATLILLIVMLVRKISGGGEKYHATPLKHD